MPGAARRRRSGHLILVERLRLLACEVEIRTNLAEFAGRLRYLVQHAEQDHPVTDHAVFEVMHLDGSYVVREDGELVANDAKAETIFDTLFQNIHRRAFAALPDDIRIHAASGMHRGRMFLLVGTPFSGKTTLTLQMLFQGVEMVGDELVMLREGKAAAFPRRFYPRDSSYAVLPGLEFAAADQPIVFDGQGAKRVAVDPTTFARPWRVARAPVATVYYLDPDFSGPTRITALPKIETVRLVMEQCTPPLSHRKGWIADLCAMVNGAATRLLTVGAPGAAAIAIRNDLRQSDTLTNMAG